MKYQYLRRRSLFLESTAGADANDPEFLNRFIARFDASNVDQNLIKLSYNGYQCTIGTGASASYLSGAYAFPDYIVNAVYVVGTYKFE